MYTLYDWIVGCFGLLAVLPNKELAHLPELPICKKQNPSKHMTSTEYSEIFGDLGGSLEAGRDIPPAWKSVNNSGKKE